MQAQSWGNIPAREGQGRAGSLRRGQGEQGSGAATAEPCQGRSPGPGWGTAGSWTPPRARRQGRQSVPVTGVSHWLGQRPSNATREPLLPESIGSSPRGTARAPRPAQPGALPPSKNPTRTGRGHTEPAIPEQTLLSTAPACPRGCFPSQGGLQAAPSSRETPALPQGCWQLLGTRAWPPFFAFSEAFHSLFPGSSSCDFPSCCQTPPWQLLPPSFLFIPTDYGGAGTSGSTKELWVDPALPGDPMRGHRGESQPLSHLRVPALPRDSLGVSTEQSKTLSSKAD